MTIAIFSLVGVVIGALLNSASTLLLDGKNVEAMTGNRAAAKGIDDGVPARRADLAHASRSRSRPNCCASSI